MPALFQTLFFIMSSSTSNLDASLPPEEEDSSIGEPSLAEALDVTSNMASSAGPSTQPSTSCALPRSSTPVSTHRDRSPTPTARSPAPPPVGRENRSRPGARHSVAQSNWQMQLVEMLRAPAEHSGEEEEDHTALFLRSLHPLLQPQPNRQSTMEKMYTLVGNAGNEPHSTQSAHVGKFLSLAESMLLRLPTEVQEDAMLQMLNMLHSLSRPRQPPPDREQHFYQNL